MPARPLTLEEAKPKIVETLKKQHVQTLLTAKAEMVGQQLREALKSGKTAEEAGAQAGVKLEKIPAFALVENAPGTRAATPPDPKMLTPEMRRLKQTVSELTPGSVSDLIPQADGGQLVILEKRQPLDTAQFESARPLVEASALQNRSQVVFYEWLRERRRSAGVQDSAPQQAPD